MNYRFKTEEEFKKEFGEDWDFKVMYSWNEDMNYLFGKKLNAVQNGMIEEEKFLSIDGWSISKDMLTAIDSQKIDFLVQGNMVTVTYKDYTATAKCHPEDEFDLNRGLAIALSRLARKLGEYETEVEKTVVVKQKVKKNILDEI